MTKELYKDEGVILSRFAIKAIMRRKYQHNIVHKTVYERCPEQNTSSLAPNML